MKCIECENDLVGYPNIQGQTLYCSSCRMTFNCEYMKQFYNVKNESFVYDAKESIVKCDDCIIGQHLQRPSLVGILVEESKRHLYFINHDEYVEFNYCPCCGVKLK